MKPTFACLAKENQVIIFREDDELDQVADQINALDMPDAQEAYGRLVLKKFFLCSDDRELFLPSLNCTKDILYEQKSLQKLFYMCHDYVPFPEEWIANNAHTLVELGLTINPDNQIVPCEKFRNCKKLANLVLEGPDSNSLVMPIIDGIGFLPATLTRLCLRNLSVPTNAFTRLVKTKLTRLRQVILRNVRVGENTGVSIPCLLWMMNKSTTIKAIKVKGLNLPALDV